MLYSLSSAICALVPLFDDHLLSRIRRRLVREAANDLKLTLSDIEVRHLSGTESRGAFGCLFGVVIAQGFKIALKLVRRVFRSVLFFLAVKDSVDAFSKTFHEGFLLHLAMPDLDQQLLTLAKHGGSIEHREREIVPEIKTVRAAVEQTFQEIDTRPIEATIKSALRGSRRMLQRAARVFVRDARKAERIDPAAEPAPEDSQRLAPELYESLTRSLLRQETYLRALAHHFRKRWRPR